MKKCRIYRRYKRGKKRGGQRYWVGRKPRRHYSGGPLFEQKLKEKEIELIGTPKERKRLRQLWEKNPELIGPLLAKKIKVKFGELPPSVGGQYDPITSEIHLAKQFLTSNIKTPEYKTVEDIFKHEIRHVMPGSEELKKMRDIEANIRADTLTKRIIEGAQRGDPKFLKLAREPETRKEYFKESAEELVKRYEELEPSMAERVTSKRKIKVSEEQISKAFKEMFK